jgi:magnesium-transporting ATPase (P-type)
MSATLPTQANEPAHARPPAEVLAELGSDADRGLPDAAVDSLRQRFGPNALAEAPPAPAWKQFLHQFAEPVVWLLLAAGGVALVLQKWTDFAAIVLLNALLGFFQQRKAESALAALRRMSSPLAKVIRDGQPRVLPAADLVPGDRVELEAGDRRTWRTWARRWRPARRAGWWWPPAWAPNSAASPAC